MATIDELGESLTFVLQQQLIDENFNVVNRTKSRKLQIAGTKKLNETLHDLIAAEFPLVEADDFDGFIDFLSSSFKVPKEKFTEKLSGILDPSLGLDTRMKFIQVAGVLREYWQDEAYEDAIKAVQNLISTRTRGRLKPSRDELNSILSSHELNESFSMLINLCIIREWAHYTGLKWKGNGYWLGCVNHLAAEVMKKIMT